MELYIGRSKWWDSCTYPRVGQWPLSAQKETALLEKYASLLVAAYATYESWKQRYYNLDGYFVGVELDSTELPDKVYVVLGAYLEKITWPGEWDPYRLRIEVVWCSKRKANPAFASAKEAKDFMQECLAAKPESRFIVVELTVVK